MILTTKMKQQLKAKAHSLKPVVLIGSQGLTDAVLKEIERALHDHQLIKIRFASDDRNARLQMATRVSEAKEAHLLQLIGQIGIFYRKRED